MCNYAHVAWCTSACDIWHTLCSTLQFILHGSAATATAITAEFTIEFDQLGDWINDVKKIFNTELFENGKKK